MTMTVDVIEELRLALSDNSEAIEALDIIEENGSDPDIAFSILSSGVRGDEESLNDLVEKAKKYLCKAEVKDGWGNLKDIFDILVAGLGALSGFTAPIAVVVIGKICDIGLRNLCKDKTD
jgi:hypothetical protein